MEEEKRGTADLKIAMSTKEETVKKRDEEQMTRDLKGKDNVAVLAPSFDLIQQ